MHEFDTQNEIDFLVTEYIPGVTLDSKLASGALPTKEVLSLGTQLAEGLSAAHEQGIVHRDLEPPNLRLTPERRLKILDFGLAQLIPHASDRGLTATLTQLQEVVGTLPYIATGRNERCTQRYLGHWGRVVRNGNRIAPIS